MTVNPVTHFTSLSIQLRFLLLIILTYSYLCFWAHSFFRYVKSTQESHYKHVIFCITVVIVIYMTMMRFVLLNSGEDVLWMWRRGTIFVCLSVKVTARHCLISMHLQFLIGISAATSMQFVNLTCWPNVPTAKQISGLKISEGLTRVLEGKEYV